VDLGNADQLETLVGAMQYTFTAIAQFNYPYSINRLPYEPVDQVCDFFRNATSMKVSRDEKEKEREQEKREKEREKERGTFHSEIERQRRPYGPVDSERYRQILEKERQREQEREQGGKKREREEEIMSNEERTFMVYAFRQMLDLYYNRTGKLECFDVGGFKSFYQTLPGMQPGSWHFQRCSELVFPFSVPDNTMFLSGKLFEKNSWNSEAFSDYCASIFGIRPNVEWASMSFGLGRDIDVTAASKIAFINGERDPWSAGGVLTTLSKKQQLVSIRMSKAAHVNDLMTPQKDDFGSVSDARSAVTSMVDDWLRDYRDRADDYAAQMGFKRADQGKERKGGRTGKREE
jgi:hypothetical protein